MAIRSPGARLLRDVPLRFIDGQKGGRKSVDAQVALIPFIDLLLTVLVFLLMSFSADGLSAQADLPAAEHGGPLELAPVVTVDRHGVLVDGRRVADVASLGADARLARIEPLVHDLEVARETWRVLHPGQEFPGRVIVQADRSTDFRVLRKVLFSVGQAGYPGIQLAVADGARVDGR
ncbi:MAG TPA: hypothetical protein DEF51_19415 [Myxococcales bacterium]|nr:hypothetical protein [Myxococcales bacterium]